MPSSIGELLAEGPRVLNVGANWFADSLQQSNVPAASVQWSPPGRGDVQLARLLADVADDSEGRGAQTQSANALALSRLVSARPLWIDVARALDVLPGMDERTILHAGPPIAWDEMCGPMQGAIVGALLYEGLARSDDAAWAMAGGDAIRFSPCHHHSAVGPMAGIISPSMPVMVVRDETTGHVAYATINEGWGRTLRFGACDAQVVRRLKWIEEVLAPELKQTVASLGGVDIRAITARALQMGDECHNRDLAATTLLFKQLMPALVATCDSRDRLAQVVDFMTRQEHFFLNVSMAACKAALLAAEQIPQSTMVTAMARNGRDLGIRVSGLGDQWFTAPAGLPDGLYFPGYSAADANPDLGDSAISETAGIGAFAMAAAPAIVQFIGGTPQQAVDLTLEMYQITLGENANYALPALGFRGTPTGIDIRRVVETGIAPVIDTGIAHKEPGHGLVGAGIARAPLACFENALTALSRTSADTQA
jgi:hypothetical protein